MDLCVPAELATQILGGLHLTFIEYGVMRNDAQEDIDAVTPADVNRLEIAAKLSQFQVVLRYPATLNFLLAI